jgi:uncharacterized membrane protein
MGMNTPRTEPSAHLESYLTRLDAALTGVSEADRREILLETRSHVADRVGGSSFRDLDDVLAELGPPEVYARQFLVGDGSPALMPPAAAPAAIPRTTLGDLAQLATGRWTSLPLLLLVASAYALAILALVLAVSKVLEPASLGLWITETPGGERSRFFFGITDRPHEGREVLGYWLIAPLLLTAAAIHLGVSRLLKRVVRRPAPRP